MTFLLVSLLLGMLAPQQGDLSGARATTVVDFGRPNTTRLVPKQDSQTLTGTLGTQALEGTFCADEISFKVGSRTAKGKLVERRLAGEVTQGSRTLEWFALRIPPRPAQPRTHTCECPSPISHPGKMIVTFNSPR
jgi:hypothetical protein